MDPPWASTTVPRTPYRPSIGRDDSTISRNNWLPAPEPVQQFSRQAWLEDVEHKDHSQPPSGSISFMTTRPHRAIQPAPQERGRRQGNAAANDIDSAMAQRPQGNGLNYIVPSSTIFRPDHDRLGSAPNPTNTPLRNYLRVPEINSFLPRRPSEETRLPPLSSVVPSTSEWRETLPDQLQSTNSYLQAYMTDRLENYTQRLPPREPITRSSAEATGATTNVHHPDHFRWHEPRHERPRMDVGIQTDNIPRFSTVTYTTQASLIRPIAQPVSRKKKAQREIKKLACVACMELFDHNLLVDVQCSCKYCNACLNDVFRAGCSSISAFPPKCHGKALRINVFGLALQKEVVARYKAVEAEFSSKRPLYCASVKCSKFITENETVQAGEYGICNMCNQCTCLKCRMLVSVHTFGDNIKICPPESHDVVALRDLGDEQDWRECPSCHMMVEKVDGCDHIECQCGVEFCYACGSFYNEFDDCECTVEEHSEDEILDDDGEPWPQHRRMIDPMGRTVCSHATTEMFHGGEFCHGCLRPPLEGYLRSCIVCSLELCQGCLDDLGATEDPDQFSTRNNNP